MRDASVRLASLGANPHAALRERANTSLLYAILFNACMFAIAVGMWRKRWFVKV